MTEITKLAFSTSIFGLNKMKGCYSFTQRRSRVWQARSRRQLTGHHTLDFLWHSVLVILSPSPHDPKWLLDLNSSRLHPNQQEKERQRVLLFPLKNTFMKFSHSISSLPHIQLLGSLGTVTFSIVFLRRKRKMYGQHRQPAISASPCFSQRPVHEVKLILFIKKSSSISQICLPKWCVHSSTYWLYCASDYP